MDQSILPNPSFDHSTKSQSLLESGCNSRGFENNELENRIYEEVHMNEGKHDISSIRRSINIYLKYTKVEKYKQYLESN